MPGIIAGLSGFVDRSIGKGIVSAGWLNRIGKSGAAAAGGGAISVQLSAAGIGNGADTTADTLFSLTLPANVFDIVGRNIEVVAWGSCTSQAATRTVALTWGASPGNASIAPTISLTSGTAGSWQFVLNVFKTASNVQIATCAFDNTGAAAPRSIALFNAGTEVDTSPIKILLTGQTSVASANSILANGLAVYGYN